jgi:flagellar protein FlgJ
MNKINGVNLSQGFDLQQVQKPKPLSQNPEKVAEQFESMLLKQMMDSMWSTVQKGSLVSNSNEESMYRDMFNEGLANSIAEGRGIGIKEVILKDLNKLSKSK